MPDRDEQIAEAERAMAEWANSPKPVLDALRNMIALAKSRPVADGEHVPGLHKCAKCGLPLYTTNMDVSSGVMSANNDPVDCPNGCGPMWKVTERDARKEAQADAVKAWEQLAAYREAWRRRARK